MSPELSEQLAALPDGPHHSTSPQYKFTNTREVVKRFEDLPFPLHPGRLVRSAFRTPDGAYGPHRVDFGLPRASPTVFGGLDHLSPRAYLYNTYDGAHRPRLLVGFSRAIGSETLDTQVADLEWVPGTAPEEWAIREELARIEATIQRAKEIRPSQDRVLWMASEAAGLRADEKEVYKTPPANLLLPRRVEDAGVDLWSRWKTVQENLLVGGIPCSSQDGRSRALRAVTHLHKSRMLNLGLWAILEALLKDEE